MLNMMSEKFLEEFESLFIVDTNTEEESAWMVKEVIQDNTMTINIGSLVSSGGYHRDSLCCLQPQFRLIVSCEYQIRNSLDEVIPLLGWPLNIIGFDDVSLFYYTIFI